MKNLEIFYPTVLVVNKKSRFSFIEVTLKWELNFNKQKHQKHEKCT